MRPVVLHMAYLAPCRAVATALGCHWVSRPSIAPPSLSGLNCMQGWYHPQKHGVARGGAMINKEIPMAGTVVNSPCQ
ncbi:hypothetical protein BKA67DRAFT_547466 [Truncatella angustata]|uniref:Secreted protein n=1 Tax=Truncatella angustata TaxID=152316 RepID=A0A9P8UXC3_9PEZI|nr:uncharacterized protein BKA67DRAFT_547466 [Truncatella angustata]KAH6660266.1 hypothetical protein BKA67DRAFT_547466 [Truncatella angustata]